jgi:hypothetical protein
MAACIWPGIWLVRGAGLSRWSAGGDRPEVRLVHLRGSHDLIAAHLAKRSEGSLSFARP